VFEDSQRIRGRETCPADLLGFAKSSIRRALTYRRNGRSDIQGTKKLNFRQAPGSLSPSILALSEAKNAVALGNAQARGGAAADKMSATHWEVEGLKDGTSGYRRRRIEEEYVKNHP